MRFAGTRVAWLRAGQAALTALLLVAAAGGAQSGGSMPGAGSIVHDPVSYVPHVRKVQAALVDEAQRARQLPSPEHHEQIPGSRPSRSSEKHFFWKKTVN
jgi:hypothetical protein